jgi:bla regulator protein BlaR1
MITFLSPLEAAFGWMVEASWQASVLAVVVVSMQWALGTRLNARWRYALWLLVVVRLVLPVQPESALSLFQFAPPPPAALMVSVTEPLFVDEAPPMVSIPAPMAEQGVTISVYSLLAIGWLAGALAMLAATVMVNGRFAQQVATSPEIDDPEIMRLFAEAKAEFGLRRAIRLVENGQVQSPAIMGLFHPALLLPTDVRAKFDARELRFIFLHELAHLKRGDVLVQALIAVLQILHWFNPVLWLAFRQMRIDREPATDALVLSRAGEGEKERYGLMLIKLLEHFNQRHSLATLVGILEDKGQFKRRFSLIAKFTRGAYGWSLLGVGLVIALAWLCLTKSKTTSVQGATPIPTGAKASNPSIKDLIASAQKGDVAEMGRLLQMGVDINGHESDRTPLLKAAESNQLGATKFLLQKGADPNVVSDTGYGYTALSLAKTPEIADLLLAAGAHLDATLYNRGVPIVYNTVSEGRPEMLNWFIAHGVDVAKARGDHPDQTLLFDADSPEVATILIQHGVDVNAKSQDGQSALDNICMLSRHPAETAQVLLEHGADPNARDASGATPLCFARDAATVEVLVAHGADVKTVGDALFRTTLSSREEPGRLKALIAHGAPFDVKTQGPTLMMSAAWRDHVDTVAYLLTLGVDPNATGTWSAKHKVYMTPLEAAVTAGAFKTVQLLVEHGATITDLVAENAVYNRYKEISRLFWEHGNRSISELTYAISQGAKGTDLAKLLEAGAPLNSPQHQFYSPLALAAQLGNLDAVKFLVDRGAVINDGPSPDPDVAPTKSSSLLMAASEGQDEMVSYLLAHGAIPDTRTLIAAADNSTPYNDQRPKEHFEKCVRLLIDAGGLKNATPVEEGNVLSSAIGTRQGPPNEAVVKMVLDAGVSPDVPMPYIVEAGEKPNSVIGYYRDYYAKNKDKANYSWMTDQIKPVLDLLEAAEKGASKIGGSAEVETAQQLYLDVYMDTGEPPDLLEAGGKFAAALTVYQNKLAKLLALQKGFPNWEPPLVAYHIRACQAKIDELKAKLAQPNAPTTGNTGADSSTDAKPTEAIVGSGPTGSAGKPVLNLQIALVEIDEKTYEQDIQAMNYAVARGDVHFFDGKQGVFVAPTASMVLMTKKDWYAIGGVESLIGSVKYEKMNGVIHTTLQATSIFTGINGDFVVSSSPENSVAVDSV